MKRVLICLISWAVIMLSPGSCRAQRDNIWCFGAYAMLDFNNGSPAATTYTGPGGLQVAHPAASVCDEQGQLLFYTDGDTIVNRLHQAMPNGQGLMIDPLILGHPFAGSPFAWSNIGSAMIVPMPDSSNKYYVFTIPQVGYAPYEGRLYYSVVNMELNNGLGDVEPGRKGLLLDADARIMSNVNGNALTAAPGDRCNIWLLAAARNADASPVLKAYSVTAAGIDATPVVTENFMAGAELLVSSDRKKLVSSKLVTLYDFDACTGTVSNGISIGGYSGLLPYQPYSCYSLAFSPDNSKLYGTSNAGPDLVQFDLSSGDPAVMTASRTLIGNGEAGGGNLELGPDGRIYVSQQSVMAAALYGVIQDPDAAGAACNLVFNTPFFSPGTGSNGFSLHNTIPVMLPRNPAVTVYRDLLPACAGARLLLRASDTTGGNYVWNDGAEGFFREIERPGTYWVQYTATCPCTVNTDSFLVKSLEVPRQKLGNDTLFCEGEPIRLVLNADVGDGMSVSWSTGNTDPYLQVTDTGHYWVTVSYPPCFESDSIHVGLQKCGCFAQVPNAFSPNGDGINDIFLPVIEAGCSVTKYRFNIFNRWGQRVFSGTDASRGWDGSYGGQPADAGTYTYELRFEGGAQRKVTYRKGDIMLIR